MVKKWKQCHISFSWALSIWMVTTAMKLKDASFLEENLWQARQCIKKQRHHFANKAPIVKAVVFPVVMYQCESWTVKKAEHCKNWCFWTVVWKKAPESPLDCKEIQPINCKENQSWLFIGRTDAEVETLILGHLMWRTDSLEKAQMLGKIEGGRRRGR